MHKDKHGNIIGVGEDTAVSILSDIFKDGSEIIPQYPLRKLLTDDYIDNARDTISLHRKKQTNTLYTINALNEIIRKENNGVLDKTFPVPWENYHNALLLTNEDGINIIPTRIYSIIDVNTWDRTAVV